MSEVGEAALGELTCSYREQRAKVRRHEAESTRGPVCLGERSELMEALESKSSLDLSEKAVVRRGQILDSKES